MRGVAWALVVLCTLTPAGVQADEEQRCVVLCVPELNVEPTVSIGRLFAAPRLRDVATGESWTAGVEAEPQVTLSVGIPTEIPHVELALETIFASLGQENIVEFEAELNLIVLHGDWTEGWLEAHIDVIYQLSPGARPGDVSRYSHKLDLELDVGFSPFNWLPRGEWLRHVSIEASLDYLATGLPRRGEVVDGLLYLDDETGWSLSLVVVVPLAPVERG